MERILKLREVIPPRFRRALRKVQRELPRMHGVDVDEAAIGWCRRNLRGDFRVLGPAPPPLGKLRGEYRAQVLVKGTNRKGIRLALQAALAGRPDVQRRAVVDIDPLSVV